MPPPGQNIPPVAIGATFLKGSAPPTMNMGSGYVFGFFRPAVHLIKIASNRFNDYGIYSLNKIKAL